MNKINRKWWARKTSWGKENFIFKCVVLTLILLAVSFISYLFYQQVHHDNIHLYEAAMKYRYTNGHAYKCDVKVSDNDIDEGNYGDNGSHKIRLWKDCTVKGHSANWHEYYTNQGTISVLDMKQ